MNIDPGPLIIIIIVFSWVQWAWRVDPLDYDRRNVAHCPRILRDIQVYIHTAHLMKPVPSVYIFY